MDKINSMAFTQAQLDALEAAIGLGVKEVDYGDKKIVYHSLAEMLALRDTIKKELEGNSSIAQRRVVGIFRSTVYKT